MECPKCNDTGRVTTERRDSRGRVFEQRSHPCTECDPNSLALAERVRRERSHAAQEVDALRWALDALMREDQGRSTSTRQTLRASALRRLLADAERRAG